MERFKEQILKLLALLSLLVGQSEWSKMARSSVKKKITQSFENLKPKEK
jgi:hypothetical protein